MLDSPRFAQAEPGAHPASSETVLFIRSSPEDAVASGLIAQSGVTRGPGQPAERAYARDSGGCQYPRKHAPPSLRFLGGWSTRARERLGVRVPLICRNYARNLAAIIAGDLYSA